MTFTVGKVYKHLKNTDVAIRVNKVSKKSYGYILNVTWFNIVNPARWTMIDSDEILINAADVSKWLPLDTR